MVSLLGGVQNQVTIEHRLHLDEKHLGTLGNGGHMGHLIYWLLLERLQCIPTIPKLVTERESFSPL